MGTMDAVSLLEPLREDWLKAVIAALADDETTALGLRPQMERFYALLLQSVRTGDPTVVDPLLHNWVWSQTITDLESEKASVIEVLQRILTATIGFLHAHFPPSEAFELLMVLQPYFVHMVEYAAAQEMHAHLEHSTAQLEHLQEELERLERSKSEFVSLAAHELKTPLTVIEGYSAMLKEAILESAPVEAQERLLALLEGISRGTGRIREIVDDLIDILLIDNRMLKLAFQPFWLDQIFRSLADELAPALSERNITLQIRPFPGIERVMFGDALRLRQAFRNLLVNAIKYTPDGGRITVDGKLLPGFVEVVIRDTGIGIALEDQRRIFDKFGHGGSPLTHSSGKIKFKGGGPGLGLPIAKGIIEAHGGSIWVESRGRDEHTLPGSTFHVLLPLRDEPPGEGEESGVFMKIASYLKSPPWKGGKSS